MRGFQIHSKRSGPLNHLWSRSTWPQIRDFGALSSFTAHMHIYFLNGQFSFSKSKYKDTLNVKFQP